MIVYICLQFMFDLCCFGFQRLPGSLRCALDLWDLRRPLRSPAFRVSPSTPRACRDVTRPCSSCIPSWRRRNAKKLPGLEICQISCENM